MKRTLVLTILSVVAVAHTSHATGTIFFSNYFTSASPRITYNPNPTFAPPGKAGLALGGSFAAELAWFNGVTTNPNQLTLVPASLTYFSLIGPGPNSTPDGDIFDASHPDGNGAGWYNLPTVLELSGVAAGTTVYGSSGLFRLVVGGGPIAPALLVSAPNFVVSVPEPSTFALAGLGAASLIVFRRRKQA